MLRFVVQMACALRPANLPPSLLLLVFSFDSGCATTHFVVTCRALQSNYGSAAALCRFGVTHRRLAGAVQSLSGMLLSAEEVGPLFDLVQELKQSALECEQREKRIRSCLACGALPAKRDVVTLPSEFDAVFLRLLLLLTDEQRCPGTVAPYAAVLHLRRLTAVASQVSEELLVALATSRVAFPRQDLLMAREAAVAALQTSGRC